jgi:murein DD-endopeptidase MepM/ murein hydrolase activator NlpD
VKRGAGLTLDTLANRVSTHQAGFSRASHRREEGFVSPNLGRESPRFGLPHVVLAILLGTALWAHPLPASAQSSKWYSGNRTIEQGYGCTPLLWEPVDNRFNCGSTAADGLNHVHEGLDVAFPSDCYTTSYPVYAAMPGYVRILNDPSGYGASYPVIQLDAGNFVVLGHVRKILIPAGQHVKAGTQIASVGHEGNATDCHLHFEVDQTMGYTTTSLNPYPTLTLYAAMTALLGFDNSSDNYYVKQGVLTATWTLEHAAVRQIALAYTPAGSLRIGYVDYSNNFYVKEGSLTAAWKLEASSVQDISLAGDLIGYLSTSGNYYVKRGALGAGFLLEHGSVRQIALAYTRQGSPRIGFVDTSNRFYVKEGYLAAAWVQQTSSAQDISLSGNLIGFRDLLNNYYVKQGGLTATFVNEAASVSQIALALTPAGSPRIGYVNGRGDFYVKEGSLTAGWTFEVGLVQNLSFSADLLSYRDINDDFYVKQGALTASWVLEQSNVQSMALAGS